MSTMRRCAALMLLAWLATALPEVATAQPATPSGEVHYTARILPRVDGCVASAKSAAYANDLHWTSGQFNATSRETIVVGARESFKVTVYCDAVAAPTLVASQLGGELDGFQAQVRAYANAFDDAPNGAAQGANHALVPGARTHGASGEPAFLGDPALCVTEAEGYFASAGYDFQGKIGGRLFVGMAPNHDEFTVIDCLAFDNGDGKPRIRVRHHSETPTSNPEITSLRQEFYTHLPLRLNPWDEPLFGFRTAEGHVDCVGSNLSGRWGGDVMMACFGRMGYVWGAQGHGEGFICDQKEGCRAAWENWIDWDAQNDPRMSAESTALGHWEWPLQCVVHAYNVNCFLRDQGRVVSVEDYGFKLLSER